jgi:hypothetical protein
MDSDTDSDVLSLSQVELDRLTLSQWYDSRGIARATAFRLLKVAGITPHKMKVPGSRAPVSALDAAMVAALDGLADRLREGESMAQLEAAAATALAPVAPSEPVSDSLEPSSGGPDAGALLERMAVAEKAIATGFPLTTAQVAWVLGARPGADAVTRGGITATRQSRNCWTLDQTG